MIYLFVEIEKKSRFLFNTYDTVYSKGNIEITLYVIQHTKQVCFFWNFSFKPIIQYVDDQFERYLNDESGLNRRHIIDNRVHCCFYFINPSGHG